MVNSGFGLIKCNQCRKGCIVHTSINRNNKREECVEDQTCEHFVMQIGIYTNNNYLSWIVGERDRISFYLQAKCTRCNHFLNKNVTCEGFSTDKGTENKSCCGNTVEFAFELIQGVLDAELSGALNLIPFVGHAIANGLVTKYEDNLKKGRF